MESPSLPSAGGAPGAGAPNFFGKLFDLSFSTFVTTSLIKVLYILLLIGAGLAGLVLLITFAAAGAAGVVLGIIAAPLIFFLYAILSRVWMEMLIVMFRIAENTEAIARNTQR